MSYLVIIFHNSQEQLPKSEIVKLSSTLKMILHHWQLHDVFHTILGHTMYHF